jgi:phosphatidylglycerol:prolipoprotein diacylglycerol transferase
MDGDHVYNLGFYSLVATVLGARLSYVLGHWTAYADELLSALSLTTTALAWPEGVLIGGVVAIVYLNRRQLPVGATLDAIAPGLTLALGLERLGAFLDGRGFGEPTTLPWAVHLWDESRHPVCLYEAMALFLVLGILWWRRKRGIFDGRSSVLFVALVAGAWLFLEAFRADAPLMANGIRTGQVVALVVVLGAVGVLYRSRFPGTAGGAEDGPEDRAQAQ